MNLYLFTLCFVQGVSEFLPVSSSAHLVLVSAIFKKPPTSLEWEVALHFGTLLAVILHFWRDVGAMIRAVIVWFFQKKILLQNKPGGSDQRSLDSSLEESVFLIIATLPALGMGLIIKKWGGVVSTPSFIPWMSILFGVFLYLSDRFQRQDSGSLTLKKAFLIGCAQVLAFIPGASRSGTCITAGRLLGLGRVEATRFAFLLSIPTVSGAVVLTTYSAIKQGLILDLFPMGLAVLLTGSFGFCVIRCLLLFLERHTFIIFMLYRVLLGVSILLFF